MQAETLTAGAAGANPYSAAATAIGGALGSTDSGPFVIGDVRTGAKTFNFGGTSKKITWQHIALAGVAVVGLIGVAAFWPRAKG